MRVGQHTHELAWDKVLLRSEALQGGPHPHGTRESGYKMPVASVRGQPIAPPFLREMVSTT